MARLRAAECREFIAAEMRKWGEVVQAAGLRAK